MEETPGYVLRISSDEYLLQLKEIKKYYPGIQRHWRKGTPILFAKKVKVDSFVGHGIVEKVEMLWEMTPEEEDYCRQNKWKQALTFMPLVMYENPLPLKETFLKDDKRKGMFLHGIKLTENQVAELLETAEDYANKASEEA
uniref:Uncharacterized protein n=1 Tax=viral metagenome TaxID=1070528 RepID=A0A6M3MFI4_9ZZZZ